LSHVETCLRRASSTRLCRAKVNPCFPDCATRLICA